MSGGPKGAKRPLERPLDGCVRRHMTRRLGRIGHRPSSTVTVFRKSVVRGFRCSLQVPDSSEYFESIQRSARASQVGRRILPTQGLLGQFQ